MHRVTVYDHDGSIVDTVEFSNFEPAFMYKGCAHACGYEKVKMEEIHEQ